MELTKKAKKIIALLVFLVTLATTIFIFLYFNKKEDIQLDTNTQNYIVTEYINENIDNKSNDYEVRYYTGVKKSYLVLVGENDTKRENVVTEVKTKYRIEHVNFELNASTDENYKDISEYADDSGFIYLCNTSVAQAFLSSEIANGKLLFSCKTPYYYEIYIEDKDSKLMRGLFIYDSDVKIGNLIYKQCNDGIVAPTTINSITAINDFEKQ
jgi:hypothetical protein